MALDLHAIASYSSMRLVDSLAEGVVVCFAAALLLRVARRQNAGTRFAIGFTALLAIAFLPLSKGFLGHPQLSSSAPAVVVPESWAVYVFMAWASVAVVLLGRVVRSLWHLHQLRTSCVPLDPASINPLVAQTLGRKHMSRGVLLSTSEKVRVPTALGLIRPTIVIPRWVLEELSAGELNQVVLHELAHLQRWDDWTNLAQQVVKALFFFHPAIWWIEKKITMEREMACDDAVLAESESPRAYAECLAHLAEKSFVQRSVALAQALVGRIAQTSQRVAKILDVNRPKGNSMAWKPAVSVMVGVGVLCSLWAARVPELVGFNHAEDYAPQLASSAPDRVSVPAMNAALIQRSTPEGMKAKPIPAKLVKKTVRHNFNFNDKTERVAVSQRNRQQNLVHLTAVKPAPAAVSQTVLLFIETGETGSASTNVYQIQLWHITILPASQAVGSKNPSKKT